MKENRRAAMELQAHNRIMAWAERNASEEKVKELRAVRQTRGTAPVTRAKELTILADIVEEYEPSELVTGESSGRRKTSSKKSGSSGDGDG